MQALKPLNRSVISLRSFSTTSCLSYKEKYYPGPETSHKVHFRRVQLFNKRHLKEHKKMLFQRFERPNEFPDIPVEKYGTRGTGVRHGAIWEHVPEMVPELIVPPDLHQCNLKPYVSYRTSEVYQEPLTSKDLFNAVYGPKILRDFKDGKLDDDGNPVDPSPEESQTAEEARIKARQTGSDIYRGGVPVSKKYKVRFDYDKAGTR